MLNAIWLILATGALCVAALGGNDALKLVSDAIFESAKYSVQLVIGLVGVMVFFLGLMRIAFDAGLRDVIARWLTPITRRLFPEVPADHPAMGAMIMNMASNVLGMGNAATPFGLKAMSELAKLNNHSGSASNAMVLFLAINASAITLLPPLGTVGVRAAANSVDPWAIWMPTLFATACSTAAAVTAYILLGRLSVFRHRPETPGDSSAESWKLPEEAPADLSLGLEPEGPLRTRFRSLVVFAIALGVLLSIGNSFRGAYQSEGFVMAVRTVLQFWALPALLIAVLLYGFSKRVRVYDSMVKGGRDALDVALMIVPYLVVILVAVAMFRASGALDVVIGTLDPWTSRIGVPAEVLPMALIRPLSGSGALGVMSEIFAAHGPDSFIGMLTSTLMGSTETTFYILAVYLGAAGVVDGRHALFACLVGDVSGFFAAVAACHFFFG
ncbi:MAG: spore maturation protein [bacterium]|nr:spore maturation protein [Deltaproteobacteria bacterium]MCP4903656.1 spore maturation protein [bacterium]